MFIFESFNEENPLLISLTGDIKKTIVFPMKDPTNRQADSTVCIELYSENKETVRNCDANKINYMASKRHVVANTVPLPAMHKRNKDAFPGNCVLVSVTNRRKQETAACFEEHVQYALYCY